MAISTKPGAPVLIVHWTETKHHGEFTDTGTLGGIYHGATTTKHRGIFVAPLMVGDKKVSSTKVMRLTKRGDFSGLISTINPTWNHGESAIVHSAITDYRPGVIGADNLVMED